MILACFSSTTVSHRLPYESHPPVGYLIVWIIEFTSNLGLPLCLVPLMCHTIGKCHLINSFLKDIIEDLSDWNDGINDNQNDLELKVRLGNIIQLYANVKELSKMKMSSPTRKFAEMNFFICIQVHSRIQCNV